MSQTKDFTPVVKEETLANFHYAKSKRITITSEIICIAFDIHGVASGCGLGILGGWIHFVSHLKDEKVRECLLSNIVKQAKLFGFSAIIATLGDSFSKSASYKDVLENMGFKHISTFENKLHGPGYMQKVYMANVADIK